MEFRKYRLEQLLTSVIDNRGKNPTVYYEKEMFPVIDNFLIKNTYYPKMKEVVRYIDEETYQNFIRGYIKKDMPLMTLVGNGIGNVTLSPSEKAVIIQNTIGFEVNENLDQKYLYYYLLNKNTVIKKFNRGSGQPSIRKTDILEMEINVPSIENQKKVVKILSVIDEKIELNNKISDNLQIISQELYRRWFNDFDFPNEDGMPYRSSGGEMVESNLGKIPEYWKALTLGEMTIRINERTKDNNFVVLSAINTGKLVKSDDFFTKQVYSKSINNYIVVRKNEFAYNPARINIGSIGINNLEFDGCVSPVYVAFKTKKYYEMYLSEFIKTSYFKKQVVLRASGSVRQTLNYDDFSLIKLVCPPLKTINEFNSIYNDIYVSINKIEQNTETLTELRKKLLPKLIGGEINLDNI